MSKNLGLLSFSALVSLLHTMPTHAIEVTDADLAVLQAHWALCHYQQDTPVTGEEMVATHANYWDEAGLPDPDDHFDLYIQAIAAIDCPTDHDHDNNVLNNE